MDQLDPGHMESSIDFPNARRSQVSHRRLMILSMRNDPMNLGP